MIKLFLVIFIFWQIGCNKGIGDSNLKNNAISSENNTPSITIPNNSNNYQATVNDIPFVFAANSPEVYVCKSKNLLTGLGCTADEINQVNQDPNSLSGLIKLWQQTPQYQEKMTVFFSDAFQQRQVGIDNFSDAGQVLPMNGHRELLQNFKESFARTAWSIVETGQPFTNTLTTQDFMLTPPMFFTYAYMDSYIKDNLNRSSSPNFTRQNSIKITLQNTDSSLSFADSVNPNSPNYLTFYVPQLASMSATKKCPSPAPSFTLSYDNSINNLTYSFYTLLLGSYANTLGEIDNVPHQCRIGQLNPPITTGNIVPFVTEQDYNQWRLVHIRQPSANEPTTQFWDYSAIHNSNVLVLNTPRVGFFTTPAFFGSWQTNSGNQHRVTMNQTLIVALGTAFDGSDSTMPLSSAALDPAHAPPNSDCYGCHRTLDPMRQYFQQNYSYYYSRQTNANLLKMPGQYAIQGVSAQGNTLLQLGQLLSQAPNFAQAWVQRLCNYANSSACTTSDPEFIRITQVFQSSGYSWNEMVAALFASSLVTYAQPTPTALANEQIVSIARMDHLCATLSARLQITDICNSAGSIVQTITSALPTDSYSRGSILAVLPSSLDLVFSSGIENICIQIALMTVDGNSTTNRYSSDSPKEAINMMVTQLMATSPDRIPFMNQVLSEHYQNAQNSNTTATNALRSTFVAACSSPMIATIGM